MNTDKVFEMFRYCITEPGCGGCPRAQCYTLNNRKVEIPADLALDVCDLLASLLKDREETKTVVCQRCGDEIEVKWSVLTKPDAEARLPSAMHSYLMKLESSCGR